VNPTGLTTCRAFLNTASKTPIHCRQSPDKHAEHASALRSVGSIFDRKPRSTAAGAKECAIKTLDSLCPAATPRRRPGPGGTNCRQPTWPLAAGEQPRAETRHAKHVLRSTRLGFRRAPTVRIIHRTAGYGPVCPVAWEGRRRETPPYPDCAEHDRQLGGGSPLFSLMLAKD
jgi:hypothetical protein